MPLDQTDRVVLKETEIGLMPAHWQVVRLGEVAAVRGGVAFSHKYQGQECGNYPFYKVSDMNLPGNEVQMWSANNWIDDETLTTLKVKPFPAGTIIFPKVGGALYTNKKRLLGCEALLDNNLMGVTVFSSTSCTPEFLLYWFEIVDLKDFSNPGPLPSITARRVKDAFIPLPPLPEQQEIARILQVVDARIQAEERCRQALEALFKMLLHELMTGRRRVPAGVNNHSPLPAGHEDAP